MRLFIAPLAAGAHTVTGDEHHYVAYVRRARIGDELEVTDGAGHVATARITAIGAASTELAIGEVVAVVSAPPRIRALVPVIKGDRMELCLEKLVEVGVDDVIVWPATRAVVKLDGARRQARLEQYRALAQAAARQSGRAVIPSVELCASLADAIALTATGDGCARVVLDPRAERAPVPTPARELAIISGPEGGFASDELAAIAAAGFAPIGLGPRTLRAETAPIVAVALARATTAS